MTEQVLRRYCAHTSLLPSLSFKDINLDGALSFPYKILITVLSSQEFSQ